MMILKNAMTSLALGLLSLLVFLLAAYPSGAEAPGQLTGSATSWDTIYITAPVDISNWALVQGTTKTRTGTLNVDATGNWKLEVKDANEDTAGYMTKYRASTGYDTDVKLDEPLKISANGGSEVSLSTSDKEILIGSGPTPQGGQDITITFKQVVSGDATILDSDHVYRIVVTFTGSITG